MLRLFAYNHASSKIASKSDAVVLKIASCRSAFFALILSDGHYDILCTTGYGALAEQGTLMRRLFHCFMTREYLAVLSSLVFSSPCAQPAHLYSFKAWHNIVRESSPPPPPSFCIPFLRSPGRRSGPFCRRSFRSSLPNSEDGGKKKREFLNRGADRISLWIASRG